MREILVDPEVIEFVKNSGQDYRVSTDCTGPVILPTEIKPPKDTDLKVKAGERVLYISRVQARYIERVTMGMIYDPARMASCVMYEDL
jgi:hypothetical protein